MEIRKVLVHSCFERGEGFAKDTPLIPSKCHCKRYISVAEAEAFVKLGLAQHVLKIMEFVDNVCDICGGEEILKKTCLGCLGAANVTVTRILNIPSEDIIFISLDGKTNTKTVQVKKSPTIEKAHIERAYVDGNEIEQARIESYGELNKEVWAELVVGAEPEDTPATGQGRSHDYGRSI